MTDTRRALAALAACLSLAGCGTSAPTRLFTVEPAAPSGGSPRLAYAGAALRVAAVRVPPAWERLEIAREVEPGQFELLEFDRWVAPLGRSLRQVLVEDLALRLPPGSVLVGDGSVADSAAITVDILSIRVGDDHAEMQAGWTVRASPTATAWRHVAGTTASTGAGGKVDGAATSRALAILMGQLADRIAESLEADLGRAGPAGR